MMVACMSLIESRLMMVACMSVIDNGRIKFGRGTAAPT